MENSLNVGLMVVFAVSGSMVLLVHQVHKRLLSNFMKKFEFEIGCEKHQTKKKVRFAEHALDLELPLEKKGYRIKVMKAGHEGKDGKVLVMEDVQKWSRGPRLEDIMPPNRAVLYKGILKYRVRKGKFHF